MGKASADKAVKIFESAAATAAELGVATGRVTNDKGADGVLQYADAEGIEADEPRQDKRLLRLIDWPVLPWLCGLYVLQLLDKGVHALLIATKSFCTRC